ncbi:AfsR/SARP family transcriptional regulator [Streptomyces marianii]|uniref:Tetratricopeptide repeat protein n=1 Tax=Streptomyces marianii TaxID=1817406 RepID=A0A5R9E924_9ACTN|nr:BTAD domain-containing putative transcriptional regulator [Streptomyces marianii]TLQ44513.1 tetratricopeptide repeat protein [Streptomyces marianii]
MRFGLLGPLTVHDAAGEIRTTGSAKLRALLGTLLLRANRVVPTDALLDALWGDDPPASARASLHNHVARLRRLLAEEDRLRAVAPGYVLRVEPGELDVDTFERHIGTARAAYVRAVTRSTSVASGPALPHEGSGGPPQAGPGPVGTGAPGGADGGREDWRTVVDSSRAALDLWRGDPLTGLYDPGDGTPATVRRLRESWLLLLEWRYDAFLQLGRPDGLGPELAALTAQYPLREAFHRQLMLVLHRTGRQAEALAAYQSLRRRLVGGLGVEPGPSVQQAHREILQDPWAPGAARPAPPDGPVPSADPVGAGGPPPSGSAPDDAGGAYPGSSPRPAQLPPAPAHFTGRRALVADLRAVLTRTGRDRPAVAVLSGMAGVGKSALALHVAHSLREEFPDGQLHLHLHGATPGMTPLAPCQSLTALLRDLGVPPRAVPERHDAAAALLRSTLAPTRTLLVLDDAASAAQVRPLLPAGAGCAVVVTSRSPLTALDGAARFALTPLSGAESAALLRAVSGREGAGAGGTDDARADGTDDMDRLAELCGRLPLALRIAAARLAARRALTPAALAGLLTAQAGRLDHLEYDDLSVRRSLSVAYEALDPDAALALRRLGAVDIPEYDAALVAQLMAADGTGPPLDDRRAVAALERLVDVALLDEVAYGRFVPHDLVRDFAHELAVRLDGEEGRAAAVERALRWFGESARQAGLALVPAHLAGNRVPPPIDEVPPFPGEAEALAWGDRELPGLVALAQAYAPRSRTALRVIRAAFPYLQRRGRLHELGLLNEAALDAARAAGDGEAEAHALTDLAAVHFMLGRSERSLALNDEAVGLWRGLGEDSWVQRGLANRGMLLERLERYEEAAEALEESLACARRLGDDYGEGIILSHLGNLHEHTDAAHAIACHERSLAVGVRLGSPLLRHTAHCNIGYARLTLGQPGIALRHFEECLAIIGEGDEGDWQSQSQSRIGLVRALHALGRGTAAARECALVLERAVSRADGFTEGLARHEHGLLLRAEGRTDEALDEWRRAYACLDGTDAKVLPELRALLGGSPGS